MQIPPLMLIITVLSAKISGMMGGYMAFTLLKKLEKYGIIQTNSV
jgi:hypothetical protein